MTGIKDNETDDELPQITEKQMNFVIGILKGKSQSDAYRDAYDCSKSTDNTVWSDSSKLASHPAIAQWLAVARRERFDLARYTVNEYMREQQELYQACRNSGNMGAAVKTHENIGKVAGYYVTQIRDLTPKVDKDLINQLESLFGAEAAQIAAQRMGYKDGTTH